MLSQKNYIIYKKKEVIYVFGYYVKSFAVGDGALVKSKIVNNCARGLVTVLR